MRFFTTVAELSHATGMSRIEIENLVKRGVIWREPRAAMGQSRAILIEASYAERLVPLLRVRHALKGRRLRIDEVADCHDSASAA